MKQNQQNDIVSLARSFYDPLGLITPLIIRIKVLIQELCKALVSWDETLQGDLLDKWKMLLHDLRVCQSIKIPRYYAISLRQVDSYRLYGFSDASAVAYAAVVFLFMRNGDSHDSRLVASKTRVAPLQQQTIPRLELLGTLLLARLISSVACSLSTEIKLESSVCYTDSQIALCWIKGLDKEWKPFIQNRVLEIRRLVPIEQWRFCPGRENPADFPSRGIATTELCDNTLWWSGPGWLGSCENSEFSPTEMPLESMLELRSTPSTIELLINEKYSISNIIEITKYSDLSRLIHIRAGSKAKKSTSNLLC